MKYKLLKDSRLNKAKQSYVTRHIPKKACSYLLESDLSPEVGQLILAKVDRLGYHSRLELPTGRRATLSVGDEIIVSYGNRYAPDQFLAEIPSSLVQCQLVASGGVAGIVISKHKKIKNATDITPIGFITDQKKRIINLKDYALPNQIVPTHKPLILAVTGSSMNAGKTTTVVQLIKGLVKADLSVASGKITGTGSGLDTWKMIDAGSYLVLDFSDFGFTTTYKLSNKELDYILTNMIHTLSAHCPDVVILEIADGILQKETSSVLQSKIFNQYIDGILFSASEALSIISAIQWFEKKQLPLIGISGLITASPLSMKEASDSCNLPVLSSKDLANQNIYKWLLNTINK